MISMQCQRCGKNEGEYFCSVCNRVVCSNCKKMENGRIYCLDDSPTKVPNQNVKEPQPNIFKTLKELIYSVAILLIGIIVIYYISFSIINGLIVANFEIIKQNFPQLSFIFTLMAYFTSFGLYAILGLSLTLAILVIVYIMKKRAYKNI